LKKSVICTALWQLGVVVPSFFLGSSCGQAAVLLAG
jgi:hypothetical protein